MNNLADAEIYVDTLLSIESCAGDGNWFRLADYILAAFRLQVRLPSVNCYGQYFGSKTFGQPHLFCRSTPEAEQVVR